MSYITLEFDDLEYGMPGLEAILKVRDHYPKMKVTLFTVPIPKRLTQGKGSVDDYKAWAEYLQDNEDWIEICPHGMTHSGPEMKWTLNTKGEQVLVGEKDANLFIDVAEHTLNELGLNWKKIWKSPHWESSPAVLEALWKRGYTIAVDPNQPIPKGGPVYLYNWSIDKALTKERPIKAHGHLYQPNANDIHICMHNLLTLPTDLEWKFVSENV